MTNYSADFDLYFDLKKLLGTKVLKKQGRTVKNEMTSFNYCCVTSLGLFINAVSLIISLFHAISLCLSLARCMSKKVTLSLQCHNSAMTVP